MAGHKALLTGNCPVSSHYRDTCRLPWPGNSWMPFTSLLFSCFSSPIDVHAHSSLLFTPN